MSKSDEFRQYAEEAMCLARKSKTETDRAVLISIAQTWVIAAAYRETARDRALAA